MSLAFAFWLLVVCGLLLYVFMVRTSAPVNPGKQRARQESSYRQAPARSRERVPAARKPAAARTKPTTRRTNAPPAKRARRGSRRGPLAWLIFKDR